jgi:hypothetical protein
MRVALGVELVPFLLKNCRKPGIVAPVGLYHDGTVRFLHFVRNLSLYPLKTVADAAVLDKY